MDPSRPATMEAGRLPAVIGVIEQQPWLERLGDEVSRLVEPLFAATGGARTKDLLHGRWLGHALHPALSDLPIGLWTGSLLLDAVGARRSAGVLSAAGSAAAVATAATGIADWTGTHGRDRRLGMAHGLLNTAGLGLQLLSLGNRLRGRRGRAQSLSVAGYTISAAAAYLGGELVFGRGVMVNHDAFASGPVEWTAVLPEADLDGGAVRKAEAQGREILLYRHGSEVHAMENACTHAGGPLDEGEVRDGIVTCPWHGSQFRLRDGAVCQGPATFPQPRLLARVRDGQVEVRGREG